MMPSNCGMRNCPIVRLIRHRLSSAGPWLATLAAGILLSVANAQAEPPGRGQTTTTTSETLETASRKKQREENLRAMEKRAADARVRLVATGKPTDAALIPQPLFHYTDLPRRII